MYMETINFKASELVLKETNGVTYLNIRNANHPALIKQAKNIGVTEYLEEEQIEVEEEETDDEE